MRWRCTGGECFSSGVLHHGCSIVYRNEDFEAFGREVDSKSPEEIKKYYNVFKKKWKELSEYLRIKARIEEGEAKRNKRSNLEALLAKKINVSSQRYSKRSPEMTLD